MGKLLGILGPGFGVELWERERADAGKAGRQAAIPKSQLMGNPQGPTVGCLIWGVWELPSGGCLRRCSQGSGRYGRGTEGWAVRWGHPGTQLSSHRPLSLRGEEGACSLGKSL